MSRTFLDLKFSPMSLHEWVANILALVENSEGRGIHCINSYSIISYRAHYFSIGFVNSNTNSAFIVGEFYAVLKEIAENS